MSQLEKGYLPALSPTVSANKVRGKEQWTHRSWLREATITWHRRGCSGWLIRQLNDTSRSRKSTLYRCRAAAQTSLSISQSSEWLTDFCLIIPANTSRYNRRQTGTECVNIQCHQLDIGLYVSPYIFQKCDTGSVRPVPVLGLGLAAAIASPLSLIGYRT